MQPSVRSVYISIAYIKLFPAIIAAVSHLVVTLLHQIMWRSLATLIQQRQGRRPSPAAGPPPSAAPPPPSPPSLPVEEPAAPPSPVAEAAPDDLTSIRGIGPGMRGRLNQAGIHTFAQIAQSTPEELRELLGDAGRLAKVEMWIEQAHDMVGST